MAPPISAKDAAQIEAALGVVRSVLDRDLMGAYLCGSAVGGGLRARSDLDVLVVSNRPTTVPEKWAMIEDLMAISGSRAAAGPARSLEITIAVQADVRPWRYPPRLDFQYGDWFRADYEQGNLTPWASPNPDLAVLLTTSLEANEVLAGPALREVVDRVPAADVQQAMLDGVPGLLSDLDGDEANVLLTLARIWTTVATGDIRSKDASADWAIARLPVEHRGPLARARAVYLGKAPDTWSDLRPNLNRGAEVIVAEIALAAGRHRVR